MINSSTAKQAHRNIPHARSAIGLESSANRGSTGVITLKFCVVIPIREEIYPRRVVILDFETPGLPESLDH